MTTTVAIGVAMTLSFAVCVLGALWYVVPWMNKHPDGIAFGPLLGVHALRIVALQVYSAQQAGLQISERLRDQIAWGDVAGAVLAMLTLAALRYGSQRQFRTLAWVFVAATIIDLVNALVGGMRENLLGQAAGVTWLILVFLVPALWTSLALIVWRLLRPVMRVQP